MIHGLKRWIRRRVFLREELHRQRQQIGLLHLHREIAELVLIEKQEKINRLIEGIERWPIRHEYFHAKDLRPEKVITAVERIARDVSEDFDSRQRAYEQTGQYDRLERALTEDPSAQDDRPPDESI